MKRKRNPGTGTRAAPIMYMIGNGCGENGFKLHRFIIIVCHTSITLEFTGEYQTCHSPEICVPPPPPSIRQLERVEMQVSG